jgi:hypothetical protein
MARFDRQFELSAPPTDRLAPDCEFGGAKFRKKTAACSPQMQLQFPKPTSVSIEINSLQNALIVLCPRAEERYRLRELRTHCCKSVEAPPGEQAAQEVRGVAVFVGSASASS